MKLLDWLRAEMDAITDRTNTGPPHYERCATCRQWVLVHPPERVLNAADRQRFDRLYKAFEWAYRRHSRLASRRAIAKLLERA